MNELEYFVSTISMLEKKIRIEIIKEIFFKFVLTSAFSIFMLIMLPTYIAYELAMPCGFVISMFSYDCVQSIKRKDILIGRISNLDITTFNTLSIKKISSVLDYEFCTNEFSRWTSHI